MTDRSIRVLFWQPNRVNPNDLDFSSCLQNISQQPNPLDYAECSSGLRIRVERLAMGMMAWEGDFVRQQTENVPPIAHPSQPLQANPNPIGHRAAFHYSIQHNILAIQSSRPGVSASAVNSFLRKKIHGHRGFLLDPCLTSNALQRIREGSPRKVEMRVARPSDLARIDPDLNSVEDSLTALQNFVEGQVVEVNIGFERSERGSLLSSQSILRLVRWATGNRSQVKRFRVKLEEEDKAIDVLAERMDKSGSVDLDPNDLDKAFNARIVFVREAFEECEADISDIYGSMG